MADFKLDDYIDVPARIVEFRSKYPEGVLQAEIIDLPEAFAQDFIAVKGYAYRTQDDPKPGTGLAWEAVPGKTPYTRLSELQNAETSAWGRAIIAVGAADAKKGIASKEDVRNRQQDAQQPYALNRRQTPQNSSRQEQQGEPAPQGDPTEKAQLIPLRKRIREQYPEDPAVKDDRIREMTLEQLKERYPDPKAVE